MADGVATGRINRTESQETVPLWKANVMVFSFLLLTVVVLFFYQLEEMRHAFMRDQMTHARILSTVFRLHVNTALESRETTDTIVEKILTNIGNFIDYLDAFEPFAPQELEGFSHRIGLFGVAITRSRGVITSSVKEWQEAFPYECTGKSQFFRDKGGHLFILILPRHSGHGCVVCALPARDFEQLQEKIGLEAVMSALRDVPGVISISIQDRELKEIEVMPRLKDAQVLVAIPIDGRVLKVVLDARIYKESLERLWKNFLLISGLIMLLGALLSYWLYRKQKAAMIHAVRMEKALSRQREEAMIGRAAATIAHEVRNPMNALYMGLQRVLFEAKGLEDAERRILELGLQSVKRVNGIISDLLEFARPIVPKRQQLDVKGLIEDLISFLDFDRMGIRVQKDFPDGPCVINADEALMRQLFLNLLKNCQEAQPRGGFLQITIKSLGNGVEIVLKNGGILPGEEEMDRLLEPYFTTKTKGSGIGLPFSKRIVESHGGRLGLALVGGAFQVTIWLPMQ